MSILDTMPNNPNCRNCGTCCGEHIPATSQEVMIIREFAKSLTSEDLENAAITQKIVEYHREHEHSEWRKHMTRCQFRDEVRKKCLIYPVRPFVCKLFGITTFSTDENQQCNFGNVNFILADDPRVLSYMSQNPTDMPKII